MTKQELVNGLTYLGTAYNKEYSQLECELHYDFLSGYNFSTFVTAIKNIIKRSRYLPRVNELIEECERCKFNERMQTIRALNLSEKHKMLVRAGIIPDCIKDEYETAYRNNGGKLIRG